MALQFVIIQLFILSFLTTAVLSRLSDGNCSEYTSCRDCSDYEDCGWCDSTQTCMTGTGKGPTAKEVCPGDIWFYHSCNTIEGSLCSKETTIISCEKYCNKENTNNNTYNKALCLKCRDNVQCFKVDNADCKTWNETKCPNGTVVPDFDDPTRVDYTVIKDNVKIINPDSVLIYICPYIVRDDDTTLFISKSELNLNVDDILSSQQSEGILHKVTYYRRKQGLSFVTGIPATVQDVIAFAHFKQPAQILELMDTVTVDERPDPLILDAFISNQISLAVPIHDFSSVNKLFKCAGQIHQDGNQSFFIVLPTSSLPKGISVGEVIISDRSMGFMETVTGVVQTEIGPFVETTLTQCKKNNKLMIDLGIVSSMSCYGGNGWSGMSYITQTQSLNMTGKTFAGRFSGAVMGVVFDFYEESGYAYIELINIEYVHNNTVHTANVEQLRREKRSSNSFFKKIETATEIEPSGKAKLTFKPIFGIDLFLDITVVISGAFWDVQTDLSAAFGGSFTVGAELMGKIEASVEDSGSLPLFSKPLFRFCIPIPYLGCIYGNTSFEVILEWTLAASGKIDFKIGGNVTAGYKVGFATAGLPTPPNESTGSSSTSAEAKLADLTLSAEVTVTPQFKADWPTIATILSPVNNSAHVPDRVMEYTEIPGVSIKVGSVEKINFFITATLGAPFIAKGTIVGCDTTCVNPEKPLRISATVGLSNVFVLLSGFGFFLKYTLDVPLVTTISACHEQPFDCCICKSGKAGHWDAASGKCLCRCCCDPLGADPDSRGCKLKSLQEQNTDNCDCKFCPDRSLERSVEPKCPCQCEDGTIKEMEADGSCDCSCPCADGSKDEINYKGECPCRCQCLNCTISKLLPTGKCDCVEVCDVGCSDGAQLAWVNDNCRCSCPDVACGNGNPPACTNNDMTCGVPLCPDCADGRCETLGRCGQCNCSNADDVQCESIDIVSRLQWDAVPPGSIQSLKYKPVKKLFIHHTVTDSCRSLSTCKAKVKWIQNLHKSWGWADIGYNFLVGEDGRAYQGRGWDARGAHTYGFTGLKAQGVEGSGYNEIAVCISVIGNFNGRKPNENALRAIKGLINCAIGLGILDCNYELYGHRNAKATDSPGHKLYDEIQTWKQFRGSTKRTTTPCLASMTVVDFTTDIPADTCDKYGDILAVKTTGAKRKTADLIKQGLRLIGVPASNKLVDEHKTELEGYKSVFTSIARKYGIHPALIAAIVSREISDKRRIPNQNKYGIMQCNLDTAEDYAIDCEAFTKDSEEYIDMMVRKKLIMDIETVKRVHGEKGKWPDTKILQGGIAAYNAGTCSINDKDKIDEKTTGKDYSNDVIARAQRLIYGHKWTCEGGTEPSNSLSESTVFNICKDMAETTDCEFYKECVEDKVDCSNALESDYKLCVGLMENYNRFDDSGKQWIIESQKCLMKYLYSRAKQPDLKCNQLQEMTFQSNPRCYLQSSDGFTSIFWDKTNAEALWYTYEHAELSVDKWLKFCKQMLSMVGRQDRISVNDHDDYITSGIGNLTINFRAQLQGSGREISEYFGSLLGNRKKRSTLESDCERFAASGDCRFYECFEEKFPCAQVNAYSHIKHFELPLCLAYEILSNNDDEVNAWMTNMEKCLMSHLLHLYQQSALKCIDIDLLVDKERVSCMISAGLCPLTTENEWTIYRGLDTRDFPNQFPTEYTTMPISKKVFKNDMYYYRELIEFKRQLGQAIEICAVEGRGRSHRKLYRIVESPTHGIMKLRNSEL